jgi:hypothetical protein
MGYEAKTIGGGPATGLAQNFTDFLNQMITSGSFGGGTAGQQFGKANPGGDAQNIFGLLNSLISNPSADASVQELISKDITRGRDDLRARFGASGGMGFGTPAAFAEGLYQAEQAPRTAMAMDQMAQGRLGALMPLFQMIQNISAMGIPQAQTVMQPKGWMQGVNLAMDVANTAANFIPGGGGGKTDSRIPDHETANKNPGGYAFRYTPLPTQQVYT